VAKLRAARRLWAKLVREQFSPQDEKSLVLRTHCQVATLCLLCMPPASSLISFTGE
jgi:methylmalonyl-CoA mutase